jgi:hypothetical protein
MDRAGGIGGRRVMFGKICSENDAVILTMKIEITFQKLECHFPRIFDDWRKALNSLGWTTGLEPATTGITILDSTN